MMTPCTRFTGWLALAWTLSAPWALAQSLPAPVAAPAPAPPVEALRAFDAQDYALAYDVLLGAGDVPRAFALAQRAVQARPQDRSWRLRLAKVAAWVQRPEVAAQQWVALFQMGDHSPDTLRQVLQWGSLSDQPEVVLQAWRVQARRGPLTPAQWQQVMALFESTVEPLAGAEFFEEQYQQHRLTELLDYAARLAEHGGDDARALRLYVQRSELEPFVLDSVLRAAFFMVQRGKLEDALALLQRHAHQVPPQDPVFWQLLGQLGWDLNDTDSAQLGYERFTRTPAAQAADWIRLVNLVRVQHPAQAATMSVEAFRRFGDQSLLLTALSLYAELGDWAAQGRVFRSLDDAARERLEREPSFLLMRARWAQHTRQPDLAWADLQRALQRRPGDLEVVQTSLWFLIDGSRTTELAQQLPAWTALAQEQAALWLPMAAANQLLERHRQALTWYRKLVRAKPDDPLTLLNYADVLERLGQTGMAHRVRRSGWLTLKQRVPVMAVDDASPWRDERLALWRLSLQDRPGDAALVRVRQLVAALDDAPSEVQREQLSTLVLGWSIVQGQFDNARAWMWRRYAAQQFSQAPLWGLSQTALQFDDAPAMQDLLETRGTALPVYDRYDIAYRLGHTAQAQTIAFDGMTQQDDEPLYERYRQHVPGQSSYLQLGAGLARSALVNAHALDMQARWVIRPDAHLVLGRQSRALASDDPVLSTLPPGLALRRSVQAVWLHAGGETRAAWWQHDHLNGVQGWQLSDSRNLGHGVSLQAELGWHMPSAISEPMAMAGREDAWSLSVGFDLSRRERLRITSRAASYASVFGAPLGHGRQLEVETSHQLKLDYPDGRLRAVLTHQTFDRAQGSSAALLAPLGVDFQNALAASGVGPYDYFVPEGSTTLQVCADLGENLTGQALRETYTRAWRPYLDACVAHNTVSGTGLAATLGVAGSITGEDHVRLQWQGSQDTAPGSRSGSLWSLRYRHYF